MDDAQDGPDAEEFALVLSKKDLALLMRMADDALGYSDEEADSHARLQRMGAQGLVRHGLYGTPRWYITARGRMIALSFKFPLEAAFSERRSVPR